jgi:hypothetical protein
MAQPPQYVINSYIDPFIHLGNVVHMVHQLCDCVLLEFSTKMSLNFLFEMVHSGLDESNNIFCLCKFADICLEAWRNTGLDPIPPDSSFLDCCCQPWLRSDYPACNGKPGTLGGSNKGIFWYGPSNNTAWMVATCHQNMRALYDVQQFSNDANLEINFGKRMSVLQKKSL